MQTTSRARRTCSAITAVALFGVAGCDPSYGVSRTAPLAGMPATECIREAIGSVVPGSEVQFTWSQSGRKLTASGFQEGDRIATFRYSGPANSKVWGALQLTETYQGKVILHQSYMTTARPPPQENIDASLPVMRRVTRAVEVRCGLSGLAAQITEECVGVRCEPEAATN